MQWDFLNILSVSTSPIVEVEDPAFAMGFPKLPLF